MKSFAFSSGLDPFDGLLRLQKELQRAFDRPVERWGWGRSARGVFPPVNVFRKRDGYVVRLEVPAAASQDDVLALVYQNAAVKERIGSDKVKREVYVPGQVVNIVTSSR